jgi:hypothetical protein
MPDYPTDLSEASIYRAQQRWRTIWPGCAGGRREGELLAQRIRVLRRGRAQSQKTAVTGVLIGFHRGELGMAAGIVYWPGLIEREMCPWAISKYFGDLVSNTSA